MTMACSHVIVGIHWPFDAKTPRHISDGVFFVCRLLTLNAAISSLVANVLCLSNHANQSGSRVWT